MASTYTTNLGIEKIGSGEQSGTWDITTNLNFDIIDQGINGVVSVTLAAAGSSGSPNVIDITDGTLSDGRNKFIEFVDGGDLGATAYVQLTPNDAEKIVFVRNSLSGSRSILVFQGTYNAANDFEVPNGKDVVLKFDGGGASATVTQVFEDLLVTAVAATTVDTTNIEVTNLKAKDGTSAGSIADSTGVVTLASSVLTTTDINGGTIDGATINDSAIGGTTPAAGAFTTLEATSLDSTPIGGTTPAAGTFTTLAATGNTTLDGTGVAKQGMPIVTEAGTTKTFALTDIGAYVRTTSGSAVTITVPANTSVAFPTGTEIVVFQAGAGQVTFSAAGGVTINSKDGDLKITGQYSSATLKKIGTDEWDMIGDLAA